MDAIVAVGPMEMAATMVAPAVVTVIKVDELIEKLVSLFDVATALAPLMHMTAVGPNTSNKRGVGAWA